MIKTNKNLILYLKKIKPISEIRKLKISQFRHPCYVKEDISKVNASIENLLKLKHTS